MNDFIINDFLTLKLEEGKTNIYVNSELFEQCKYLFTQEKKKIAEIKKIRPLHKNAIKLAKYALGKAKQKNITGYEVELACLTFNFNNLSDCVYHLINYFSGRIKQNGSTVDKVLQKLK